MESDIYEMMGTRAEGPPGAQPFDKRAWAERKRQERQEAFARALAPRARGVPRRPAFGRARPGQRALRRPVRRRLRGVRGGVPAHQEKPASR